MASFLTRGQIITEATKLSDNPTITTRARVFLKLFESFIYRIHPFQFREKVSADLTSTQGSENLSLSSITDMGTPIHVWVKDSSVPVSIVPLKNFFSSLQDIKEAGSTGIPTRAAWDRANNRLVFDTPWSEARTIRLIYMYDPSGGIPNPLTDASGFDASTPPLQDSYVLVNAVAEFVRRWDRDSMLGIAKALKDETLEALIVAEQSEEAMANAQVMQMEPTIFPRLSQDDL